MIMRRGKQSGCSLFVPSAVVNEVFDLLILDADLDTLENNQTNRPAQSLADFFPYTSCKADTSARD